MVIRASVADPYQKTEVKEDGKGDNNADKEEMIKECAERVMEMISKKFER
jgi:hypothetical protein